MALFDKRDEEENLLERGAEIEQTPPLVEGGRGRVGAMGTRLPLAQPTAQSKSQGLVLAEDMPTTAATPEGAAGVGTDIARSFKRGALGLVKMVPEVAQLAQQVVPGGKYLQPYTPFKGWVESMEATARGEGWKPTEKAGGPPIELARILTDPVSVAKQISENVSNPHFWASQLPEAIMSSLPALVGGAAVRVTGALTKTAAALEAAKKANQMAEVVRLTKRMRRLENATFYPSFLLEAGQAEQRIREYEKETGQDVNWTARVLAIMGGGYLGGKLEQFSYDRLLRGLGKDSTVAMIKRLMDGKNGKAVAMSVLDKFITEGSTEAAQEVVANAFQKYGYDPDQSLVEGVVESLLIGAVAGGIMGAPGVAGEMGQARAEIRVGEQHELEEQLANAYRGPHSEFFKNLTINDNLTKSAQSLRKYLDETQRVEDTTDEILTQWNMRPERNSVAAKIAENTQLYNALKENDKAATGDEKTRIRERIKEVRAELKTLHGEYKDITGSEYIMGADGQPVNPDNMIVPAMSPLVDSRGYAYNAAQLRETYLGGSELSPFQPPILGPDGRPVYDNTWLQDADSHLKWVENRFNQTMSYEIYRLMGLEESLRDNLATVPENSEDAKRIHGRLTEVQAEIASNQNRYEQMMGFPYTTANLTRKEMEILSQPIDQLSQAEGRGTTLGTAPTTTPPIAGYGTDAATTASVDFAHDAVGTVANEIQSQTLIQPAAPVSKAVTVPGPKLLAAAALDRSESIPTPVATQRTGPTIQAGLFGPNGTPLPVIPATMPSVIETTGSETTKRSGTKHEHDVTPPASPITPVELKTLTRVYDKIFNKKDVYQDFPDSHKSKQYKQDVLATLAVMSRYSPKYRAVAERLEKLYNQVQENINKAYVKYYEKPEAERQAAMEKAKTASKAQIAAWFKSNVIPAIKQFYGEHVVTPTGEGGGVEPGTTYQQDIHAVDVIGAAFTSTSAFVQTKYYDGSFPIPKMGGIVTALYSKLYANDSVYRDKINSTIKQMWQDWKAAYSTTLGVKGAIPTKAQGTTIEKPGFNKTITTTTGPNQESSAVYQYGDKLLTVRQVGHRFELLDAFGQVLSVHNSFHEANFQARQMLSAQKETRYYVPDDFVPEETGKPKSNLKATPGVITLFGRNMYSNHPNFGSVGIRELLQNSLDAIAKKDKPTGNIRIKIDNEADISETARLYDITKLKDPDALYVRKIEELQRGDGYEVEDDGVGMDADTLGNGMLACPSSKFKGHRTLGGMGIGAIIGCVPHETARFEILTRDNYAASWLADGEISIQNNPAGYFNGTKIRVVAGRNLLDYKVCRYLQDNDLPDGVNLTVVDNNERVNMKIRQHPVWAKVKPTKDDGWVKTGDGNEYRIRAYKYHRMEDKRPEWWQWYTNVVIVRLTNPDTGASTVQFVDEYDKLNGGFIVVDVKAAGNPASDSYILNAARESINRNLPGGREISNAIRSTIDLFEAKKVEPKEKTRIMKLKDADKYWKDVIAKLPQDATYQKLRQFFVDNELNITEPGEYEWQVDVGMREHRGASKVNFLHLMAFDAMLQLTARTLDHSKQTIPVRTIGWDDNKKRAGVVIKKMSIRQVVGGSSILNRLHKKTVGYARGLDAHKPSYAWYQAGTVALNLPAIPAHIMTSTTAYRAWMWNVLVQHELAHFWPTPIDHDESFARYRDTFAAYLPILKYKDKTLEQQIDALSSIVTGLPSDWAAAPSEVRTVENVVEVFGFSKEQKKYWEEMRDAGYDVELFTPPVPSDAAVRPRVPTTKGGGVPSGKPSGKRSAKTRGAYGQQGGKGALGTSKRGTVPRTGTADEGVISDDEWGRTLEQAEQGLKPHKYPAFKPQQERLVSYTPSDPDLRNVQGKVLQRYPFFSKLTYMAEKVFPKSSTGTQYAAMVESWMKSGSVKPEEGDWNTGLTALKDKGDEVLRKDEALQLLVGGALQIEGVEIARLPGMTDEQQDFFHRLQSAGNDFDGAYRTLMVLVAMNGLSMKRASMGSAIVHELYEAIPGPELVNLYHNDRLFMDDVLKWAEHLVKNYVPVLSITPSEMYVSADDTTPRASDPTFDIRLDVAAIGLPVPGGVLELKDLPMSTVNEWIFHDRDGKENKHITSTIKRMQKSVNEIEHLNRNMFDEEATGGTPFQKYTLPGEVEEYIVMGITLPTEVYPHISYRNPHFAPKNLLVHVRMTIRKNDKGERILFIEEIQSDWHQAIERRKKLFNTPELKRMYEEMQEIEKELLPLGKEVEEIHTKQLDEVEAHLQKYGTVPIWMANDYRKAERELNKPLPRPSLKQMVEDYFSQEKGSVEREWAVSSILGIWLDENPKKSPKHQRLMELHERMDALEEQAKDSDIVTSLRSVAPSAPFTGRRWLQLAIKYMMRYAAEHGFAGVAFPTPEMVPLIQHWAQPLNKILANDKKRAQYGAIIERYRNTVPDFLRPYARKYGTELTTTGVPFGDSNAYRHGDVNQVEDYLAGTNQLDTRETPDGVSYEGYLGVPYIPMNEDTREQLTSTSETMMEQPAEIKAALGDAKFQDGLPAMTLSDVDLFLRETFESSGATVTRIHATAVPRTPEAPVGTNGWRVDFPSGATLFLDHGCNFTYDSRTLEQFRQEAMYPKGVTMLQPMGEYGWIQKPGADKAILGVLDVWSVIRLAKMAPLRTLNHELFHLACAIALTPEQQLAVLQEYKGNWELAARAYANFNPDNDISPIFSKMWKFFRRIYNMFFGHTTMTAKDVFTAIRNKEVWKNVAKPGTGLMLDNVMKAELQSMLEEWLECKRNNESLPFTEQVYNEYAEHLAKQSQFEAGMLPTTLLYKAHQEAIALNYPDKVRNAVGYYAGKTADATQGWFNDLWTDAKQLFAAATLGDKAKAAHAISVTMMSEMSRELAIAETRLKRFPELFKRFADDDIENRLAMAAAYDKWEKGELSGNPELDAAVKEWKEISDHFWNMVDTIHEGAAGYVEDYFPRLFKDPQKAQNAMVDYLAKQGRSLTGPEGFTKPRIMALFSESIKPKELGGLGLEPLFDNVGNLMMANLMEKTHFIIGMTIFHSYQENGFVQLHAKGKQPSGWMPLDDKVWRKYRPKLTPEEKGAKKQLKEKGINMKERLYYAPPEVASVLANFTSPGMRRSALFRAYDNITNKIRTILVQLSGFHFMFTGFSYLSQTVGQWGPKAIGAMMRGDLRKASSMFGNMIKQSNLKTAYKTGGELIEEYLNPDSHPELKSMVDLMVKGGIRVFGEDREFTTQLTNHLVEAWPEVVNKGFGPKQQTWFKKVVGFTMAHWVPRIKAAAIMQSLAWELDVLEKQALESGVKITEEMQIEVAQRVARNADNIYGQMVYDNLSMRKAAKDWLRFFIAFPGWNIGSTTKYIGALSTAFMKGENAIINLSNKALGTQMKTVQVPESFRMSFDFYAGMFLVCSITGGLLNLLMTGEPPDDIQDMLNPRTGGLLSNGAPERVRLPTYMRDAYGFAMHPIETTKHKLNWPIRMWNEVIENQDFFGRQIRDPYAAIPQQVLDTMSHIGKSLIPFGISGMMRSVSPTAKALNLVGITTTPRSIANTKAMNIIDNYNRLTRPATTTKAQSDTIELKRQMETALLNGDADEFKRLLYDNVMSGKLTRTQVKHIIDEANEPPTVPQFNKLPLDWALRAFQAANPEERERWQPFMIKKIAKAKPEKVVLYKDVIESVLRDMNYDYAADKLTDLQLPESVLDETLMQAQQTITRRIQERAIEETMEEYKAGYIDETRLYNKLIDNFDKLKPQATRSIKELYKSMGIDYKQWGLGVSLRRKAQTQQLAY